MCESSPRPDRGEDAHAEMLTDSVANQQLRVPPEVTDRAWVVTQGEVCLAHEVIRSDREREVLQISGDGQGAPARVDRSAMLSHEPAEGEAHVGTHTRQATLIVDRLCKSFRSPKVVEDPLELAERDERDAQAEQQIDDLLDCRHLLWEMAQRGQRLLEDRHGDPVGRTGSGLLSCLPAVHHRAFPKFTAHRMVGEFLNALGEAVAIEPFHSLHDTGM